MSPTNCSRRAGLARNLIGRLSRGSISCPEALLTAIAAVVPVTVISLLVAYMIGLCYQPGDVSKTSINAQDAVTLSRVAKALIWAPLFENALVAIGLSMVSGWRASNFWTKPLVIGLVLSALHVLLAGDFRPFSVLPAFVLIAFLIERTDSKRCKMCGFIASLMFHALCNSPILIPYFIYVTS